MQNCIILKKGSEAKLKTGFFNVCFSKQMYFRVKWILLYLCDTGIVHFARQLLVKPNGNESLQNTPRTSKAVNNILTYNCTNQ